MWNAENSQGYQSPVGVSTEAVICTLFEGKLAVLLIHHDGEAWSLPGGFLGATETPEETTLRKLKEKTGVLAGYIEQLRTYADPGRDGRGWIPALAYLALIPAQELTGAHAQWWPIDALPAMAFDHQQIVEDAVARLRGKLWYSNVAVGLLPESFPLSQARMVYEAISGGAYDPANFRRDLLHSGLVASTGQVASFSRGRPALLYRFAASEATWIPAKGMA